MNTVSRGVAQFSARFMLRLQSSYSTSYSATAVAKPFDSSNHNPSDYPKPREIPFQAKVSNSVNLIGYITQPVRFQSLSDIKDWAVTSITHRISSDSQLRIPIIFEGDLAHVAACHLKENDHVHVAGQLYANSNLSLIDEIGIESKVQIYVKDINFVEGSSHKKQGREHWQKGQKTLSKQPKEGPLKDSAFMSKNGSFLLNNWQDLIDNPKEWWDYRASKLGGTANPKHPDFKRKDGQLVLWLDRAPVGVKSELEKLQFDVPMPRSKEAKGMKGEESWKKLVENPAKWWDNRENKINAKAPDFKHKETGVGLWLSDCPTWVLSQLPPLKSEKKKV